VVSTKYGEIAVAYLNRRDAQHQHQKFSTTVT
jgi:hypothetical protein